MKAKIRKTISSVLAVAAVVFIIIASVVQWIPNTYYKTGREARYTTNITTFLENSTHFAHYLEKQDKGAENEKN